MPCISAVILKIPRWFEGVPDFVLDKRQLKAIILHALQTVHGQVRTNVSWRRDNQAHEVGGGIYSSGHNQV